MRADALVLSNLEGSLLFCRFVFTFGQSIVYLQLFASLFVTADLSSNC